MIDDLWMLIIDSRDLCYGRIYKVDRICGNEYHANIKKYTTLYFYINEIKIFKSEEQALKYKSMI